MMSALFCSAQSETAYSLPFLRLVSQTRKQQLDADGVQGDTL